MCKEHSRGTLPESLVNLRQPMPLKQKLYLVFRNNWIKIRTRSSCCGNHGEPGC